MEKEENVIEWEHEKGSIDLTRNGRKDRIVLLRKGFLQAFFDEIEKVAGKDTLTMLLRALLSRLGAPRVLREKASIESLYAFNDAEILPVSLNESNIPSVFTYDGKSREMTALGNTQFEIETTFYLQKLKEVMVEVLTERGANAILRRVSKMGGIAVANKACVDYGWTELDTAMASMDQILSSVFPLYGWGRSRTITRKSEDGNYIFFLKCWNAYETDGIASPRPVCVMLQNYLEGVGEGFSHNLAGGKSTESREVKCRARGDEYCAYFVIQRDVGVQSLDWRELEPVSLELDSIAIHPDT
jgi:predicted hydrocarbon binding protein